MSEKERDGTLLSSSSVGKGLGLLPEAVCDLDVLELGPKGRKPWHSLPKRSGWTFFVNQSKSLYRTKLYV